ncbi:hypothetical protein [Streptomyces gardneri]|uniref:Uncharacterized protein n=1 Tax=Streptomyces gardneri TaxID=66892 RepID=A0A4Y3RKF1_9ACTN|nr:hypothetical protein [Streptomyces gardneri]GEB57193.1 hypothetical protein SGA01_27980 [Streptomyces gardneri]GHH22481.1 hypothetical protein GCM10017674_78270 [Streptomyces gardneri]
MTTSIAPEAGGPPEYGVPSAELVARAESGFVNFLARFDDDEQGDEKTAR